MDLEVNQGLSVVTPKFLRKFKSSQFRYGYEEHFEMS